MKPKLLLLLPFFICGYGFLPVSFRFDRASINNPNTLLIRHQECGCPCPEAYVKGGQMTIPINILNTYSKIDKSEINITGKNLFEHYEPGLASRDIIVIGKVVGVDTVLCNPSDCEVVPVFKIDKWSVEGYYPRLWTYDSVFFIVFLFSTLLSGIIVLLLIWITIRKLLTRRNQSI